jgi:hypothetical protein
MVLFSEYCFFVFAVSRRLSGSLFISESIGIPIIVEKEMA